MPKRDKVFQGKSVEMLCVQILWVSTTLFANTIFHKSDTPLRLWFYAIFLYTSSEGNISAKELQRRLGVTYKCAWRMTQKIQSLFIEDTSNEHTSLQDTLI